MYDTNPELDREVVRAIIESVTQRNSTLTYGDLARIVGANRDMVMSAQSFGFALGRIQDYCLKLDLPSLPVMVTNKSGNPEKASLLTTAKSIQSYQISRTRKSSVASAKIALLAKIGKRYTTLLALKNQYPPQLM